MEKKFTVPTALTGESGMRKERTSHHSKSVLLLSQKLSTPFPHHEHKYNIFFNTIYDEKDGFIFKQKSYDKEKHIYTQLSNSLNFIVLVMIF